MKDWPGQTKNQWIRRWRSINLARFRYWFWYDQTAGGQGGNRHKPNGKKKPYRQL